jgi:hypothetical protein
MGSWVDLVGGVGAARGLDAARAVDRLESVDAVVDAVDALDPVDRVARLDPVDRLDAGDGAGGTGGFQLPGCAVRTAPSTGVPDGAGGSAVFIGAPGPTRLVGSLAARAV